MVRPIPVPEKTEEGDMMRHFGCLEGHGTLTPLGFKIWPNKDKRRTRLFFFFFWMNLYSDAQDSVGCLRWDHAGKTMSMPHHFPTQSDAHGIVLVV